MELRNSGKKVNEVGARVWEESIHSKGFNHQGLFLVGAYSFHEFMSSILNH